MFEYISGKVAETALNYVVIDVNGVGYKIFTSGISASSAREHAKFFTYLHVREEEQTLYGFVTSEERNLFLRLIGISGIGPKVAIAILSAMSVKDVVTAIMTADVKAFSAVSGVGAKTAQRIILELKESIGKSFAVDQLSGETAGARTDIASEAVNALITLGYSKAQAAKAVNSVKNVAASVEDMIVMALKNIE